MKMSMSVTIELQETGDFDMSTTIPQRASRVATDYVGRQTADVEEQYDDTLNSTPRSALHFRQTLTPTDDLEPQPVS